MRLLRYLFVFAFIVWVCMGSVSGAAQNPFVVLETNFGNIVIELYPEAAPATVDNFLNYVNRSFYDGLLFHRVIEGFMIQTGKYLYYNGMYYYREADAPIINEGNNGLRNIRGTISTALGDGPDTATSQFFINQVNNFYLDYDFPDGNDYGHCVFGSVVQGMEVVDTIAALPTVVKSFSEAFPNDPMAGMYRVYVLPCDNSYGSDLSFNGRIGLEDFAIFASHWLDGVCGSANGFCDGADLDYSGGIDVIDLNLFWNHWTRTAGYEARFSDLAYDKAVDVHDFNWFISHWLDTGCDSNNNFCDQADINRDGAVDFNDFYLLSTNWLKSIP